MWKTCRLSFQRNVNGASKKSTMFPEMFSTNDTQALLQDHHIKFKNFHVLPMTLFKFKYLKTLSMTHLRNFTLWKWSNGHFQGLNTALHPQALSCLENNSFSTSRPWITSWHSKLEYHPFMYKHFQVSLLALQAWSSLHIQALNITWPLQLQALSGLENDPLCMFSPWIPPFQIQTLLGLFVLSPLSCL